MVPTGVLGAPGVRGGRSLLGVMSAPGVLGGSMSLGPVLGSGVVGRDMVEITHAGESEDEVDISRGGYGFCMLYGT